MTNSNTCTVRTDGNEINFTVDRDTLEYALRRVMKWRTSAKHGDPVTRFYRLGTVDYRVVASRVREYLQNIGEL